MDKSTDKKSAPRHGGHSAVTRFRKGKIDNRSREGRYLKTMRESFIQDLGGELNTTQQILLDRVMEKLLFLKLIGEHAKENGKDIVKGGRLIPCLGENYIAYDNALQRNLKLLFELKEKNQISASDAHMMAVMGHDARLDK